MSTQLTQDEFLKLLHVALEAFRADVDPDISASKILTLIATARYPGQQQLDLSQHIKGASSSSLSRHVMDWSKLDKNRQPGPDFIEQTPDPEYRRRNVLFLTAKGQQFIAKLLNRVNAALTPKTRARTN